MRITGWGRKTGFGTVKRDTELKDLAQSAQKSKTNRQDRLELSPQAKMNLAVAGAVAALNPPQATQVKAGSYILHFTDSAQIQQAVKAGYLEIGGSRLELTEEIKGWLQQAEEQVNALRHSNALLEMTRQEAEAAKEKAEAEAEALKTQMKMLEIARRIASGGIVPPGDEQKLMEFDHALYLLSKVAGMAAKEHEEYDSVFEDEDKQQEQGGEEAAGGSQPSFEVQMGVSIDSGGGASVTGVAAAMGPD